MKEDRKRYEYVHPHSGNVLASCCAKNKTEAKILLSYFIANHPTYKIRENKSAL